jgi:hypothetical protein
MQEAYNPSDYIPGNCNIGPEEIKKRLRIGYIGLAAMITFILIAELNQLPQVWKLALFAPAVYATSGFVQARQRFCFLFGFLGIFSIAGKRSRVKDLHQLRKDRRKAYLLVSQVFIGAVIITLLYYFLS